MGPWSQTVDPQDNDEECTHIEKYSPQEEVGQLSTGQGMLYWSCQGFQNRSDTYVTSSLPLVLS